VINSFTFNAYNNYNEGTGGDVHIALGNTDAWDANVVTWNSSAGDHGASLDSIFLNASNVGSFVSWDVSGINQSEFLLDDYATLYLYITNVGSGNNWHDFENEEWSGNNESYLHIDYSIRDGGGNIPEPTTLALIGLGLAGIGWKRRKAA
ncbi:MAG: PEP-CTERM sorting domain-containing protein, partial [Bacteroidetes bacterium]|nr:PEP-CTERM sorting domain-containing protein [Bacteroidota bacterium]